MKSPKRVYLDFAAATPLSARVVRAYTKALMFYGNASAPHTEGRAARAAFEDARAGIAKTLAVKAEELVVTSGGTESNALAILGTPKGHCVTTTIEHSSILKSFKKREENGSRVTYVKPKEDGLIAVEDILAALRPNTMLVSVHHVQSETGTVQRISDIGREIKKVNPKIIFHVDAAQSPLWIEAGPHALQADLVTYDAQKVGGPKGVGLLYRNFDISLAAIMGGGTQERSLRPGTENVPALVAARVAFVDAKEGRKERAQKVAALRDELIERILEAVPSARVLGSRTRRVANNVFVAIPGVDADYLAVLLDTHGVAVTPRSACLGSGGAISETAYALTHDESLAASTIRFSLGPTTTKADIARTAKVLGAVLQLSKT